MTTRIIICRHGNTFDKGDVITRVGARTDLALSTSGQVQAEKLRRYFETGNNTYKFERAFCSNLRRTRETAIKILEGGHTANLSEKAFLKEIDYGVDENRPEDEVVARLGQQAILDWDEYAIVPDGWHVDPAQIQSEWRRFLTEMSKTPGDILVVTSNGIARFCLDAVHKIACENPSLKLSTASFGLITCDAQKFTIESWNMKAPK